jgi:hypothetical protein
MEWIVIALYATAFMDSVGAIAISPIIYRLPLDGVDSRIYMIASALAIIGLNTIHVGIVFTRYWLKNNTIALRKMVMICLFNVIAIVILIITSVMLSNITVKENTDLLQLYNWYITIEIGWTVFRICLFFVYHISSQ